jgi:hypothetical protein
MGVIVWEEYVCDYCGTSINGEEVLVGRLSLRRPGSRGLARNMQVILHAECSDKLIRYAKPLLPATKRARSAATGASITPHRAKPGPKRGPTPARRAPGSGTYERVTRS